MVDKKTKVESRISGRQRTNALQQLFRNSEAISKGENIEEISGQDNDGVEQETTTGGLEDPLHEGVASAGEIDTLAKATKLVAPELGTPSDPEWENPSADAIKALHAHWGRQTEISVGGRTADSIFNDTEIKELKFAVFHAVYGEPEVEASLTEAHHDWKKTWVLAEARTARRAFEEFVVDHRNKALKYIGRWEEYLDEHPEVEDMNNQEWARHLNNSGLDMQKRYELSVCRELAKAKERVGRVYELGQRPG